MKYDFKSQLENNLAIKINGGLKDAKKWITGKEAAAAACREISLTMALEVYMKSSLMCGRSVSLEAAICVITEAGYTEEEIRQAAMAPHFSVFNSKLTE